MMLAEASERCLPAGKATSREAGGQRAHHGPRQQSLFLFLALTAAFSAPYMGREHTCAGLLHAPSSGSTRHICAGKDGRESDTFMVSCKHVQGLLHREQSPGALRGSSHVPYTTHHLLLLPAPAAQRCPPSQPLR